MFGSVFGFHELRIKLFVGSCFGFSLQIFVEFLLADPASIAANQAGKEEVDARSVFVGNVRISMFLFSLYSSLIASGLLLILVCRDD